MPLNHRFRGLLSTNQSASFPPNYPALPHFKRRNNSVQSRVGAARQSEPFNEHWSRRAFTETWLNRPKKRIRSPKDFWTAIGRDGLASTRPGCLIMHFAPCARLTWTLVTKGQQVTNTVPHTQIPPFHNVSVTPSSIRQLGSWVKWVTFYRNPIA